MTGKKNKCLECDGKGIKDSGFGLRIPCLACKGSGKILTQN